MLAPSPLPQPLFSLLPSLQPEQALRTRARGRRVRIPCVQPGLVESTASGMVPSTWHGWDGQGVLDMLGKAGFGQKKLQSQLDLYASSAELHVFPTAST